MLHNWRLFMLKKPLKFPNESKMKRRLSDERFLLSKRSEMMKKKIVKQGKNQIKFCSFFSSMKFLSQ